MLAKLDDLNFQMQLSQRELVAKPQAKSQWQVRVEVTGAKPVAGGLTPG